MTEPEEQDPQDLDVKCEDATIVVTLGGNYVRLTSHEAQRFGRDVTRAYMEAGI